ncbi:phosphatase 2C-domain-containing protein [Circinella umbellata]|nr:phosphatase 2C-domain-containing protein [Circinella umbellata]
MKHLNMMGIPLWKHKNMTCQEKMQYCIRIFRPDGTFATLQLPLSTSANEIVQRLASKFFMPDLSKLNLMIKRNKLERILQPTERPLQIQKTLLEQMGYSEQDNIEDVGREDNSYLLRYVFGQNMGNTGNEHEADYSEHQHIDLQARNLPTVPIFLYKYAQRIVSLDLSKNLQMEIPVDFIQMCRHLKQLWLANNDYVAIPQSIRFVRGLEHLNISGNRLRDLQHARLEDIPGLKTMRVYNNRLEKLPQSFASFKQLTMLFVSNNAFTTFPEVICEITSLAYLDISFNKIQSFPDEIGNLKNLVRLFAIANRFSGSLPPSFAKLENLQELDIRQNLITELDVLSQLPKLEILFVGYNAVSIVGCEFKSLRQLKMTKNHLTQFNLGGSRRSSEENNQHNSNTVTGIPAPIATSFEGAMLTDLDLSSCMLSSLPEDVFLYTPLLEELVLDNNSLNSIPSSIGALRKLLRLSVQSNVLDSLPSEISKLGELKVLDAQKNNLKMLPKEIWLCASLQTLNCSSNLLETFPKPFSAPGVALHLPMAPQPDAVVPPSVVANANDGVLPSPLGGHAGQGMVPGTTGAFRDPSSTMDDNNTMAVSPGSTLQSPPNFNPPSFFASPRNHPPPLSLSLRRLFLGDNRLTNEIWSPLMLFLELRTLNLSFNDLDEIPPEHLCHQHLYELYLSGNHLTSLPADDIEKLSYLRVLAVNGNKLQTLPAEIGKLRKLLVLDVGNNVLKYNIANWPYDWNWNWNLSLKFLNLSGNKRLEIKKMHPEAQGPKEKDLADFSALTRLRMLGLMDITILGVSIPEESSDRRVRTSPSEVNNMAYGIADWLGSNEHLGTWDLVMPRFRNNDDESIFGLFDGRKSSRTGCKLTKFLNDHLTYHVMNELRKLKEDDTVVSALRRSFLSLEKGLGGQIGDEKDSGASAVVCYISGTKLYVANVGDAMAVISRNNGQAYEITHKHISLNPSEISRIRAAGGYVSNTGKLNGELKVSRGFGYFDLIPVVNANPYVATIELSENDEFVIMASRGLWERMNYQTAVDVARTEKDDLMAAAQKLRDFAITYGAEKDLMVMVIGVGDLFDKRDKRFRFLRGPGRGAAGADAAGILLDDVSLGPAGLLGGKNKRRGKEEGPGDSTLARLDREVPPPINQVALVFTDIKSSTLLWETQPESMRSAIKIHDAVMRRTLRSVGGYEVKTEGDAFMVCFQNITSALLWCFTVQLQLLDADWPAGILSTAEGREITDQESGQVIYRGLSVRMGVHWGTPVFERNPITSRMDYFGPVVNKASRICNAADGGQICVSSDVVAALRNFPGVLDDNTLGMDDLPTSANNYLISRDIQQLKRLGFHVMELGVRRLKGLETPEMLSLVYPKQLAGRMELEEQNAMMEENTNGNNASSTAAGTPGTTGGTTTPAATSTQGNKSPSASPRLLATAETSRTTSPHPIEEEMEVESKDEVEPEDPAVKVVEDSFAKRLPRPSTMSFKPSNSSAGTMNRAIDPNLVSALSSLAIRLERLTTGNKQRTTSKSTTMNKMIERHIMYDANDEELMSLMENFVTRVENAVSTLYLHKVGHFANVLEKLGEAIEVDSMHILRALQMYSDVAGLTESPAGLAPL